MKTPIVRWGISKPRLKYIEELKSRGEYEKWKKDNEFFLFIENLSGDGIIIGLFLSLIVGYYHFEIGAGIFIGAIILGLIGVIVSLILDSKIPPTGKV